MQRVAVWLTSSLLMTGLAAAQAAESPTPKSSKPPAARTAGGSSAPADKAALVAPLAGRVPSSVQVYAGWAGAKVAGPEFAASRLKMLTDKLDAVAWSNAVTQIATSQPATVSEPMLLLRDLLPQVLEHPAAIFLSSSGGWCLMVDAGSNAADLVKKLGPIVDLITTDPAAEVGFQQFDTLLVIEFGALSEEDLAIVKGTPGKLRPLSESAMFRRELAGSSVKNPLLVLRISGDLIRSSLAGVRRYFTQTGEDLADASRTAFEQWPVAVQTGVSTMDSIMLVSGFDADQWRTDSSLWFTERRPAGLASLLGKQVAAEHLDLVPASADSAAVLSLDVPAFYKIPAIKQRLLMPDLFPELSGGVKDLGELIDQLGDTLVVVNYNTPGSTILVMPLPSPAKASEQLDKLMEQVLANEPMWKKLPVRGGGSMYSANLVVIQPSVAVKDGNLLFSLRQPLLSSYRKPANGGIGRSEAFQALKARLVPEGAEVFALHTSKLDRVLPGFYGLLQLGLSQVPPELRPHKGWNSILPSEAVLRGQLAGPAGSAMYWKGTALHHVSIEPLPSSLLFDPASAAPLLWLPIPLAASASENRDPKLVPISPDADNASGDK